MQFAVAIHSKMRTRRGAHGLSLVRSFRGENANHKARTYSELGTSDFTEILARESLSRMEQEIAYNIDQRLVDEMIEDARRR